MCKLRFWFLAGLFAPAVLLASELPSLEKRVVERTLSNGIKLLILERHFSPTVSIRMMFRTGSADEVSGKTGLAHMFEHMLFKGTRTLGTTNYAAEAPLLKQVDALRQQLLREKDKGGRADQGRIAQLLERLRAVEEKANAWVVENELWNLYEREGASALNANTSRDYTQYIVDLPSNKLTLWALLDSDRIRNPVFRQFYQEREVVKEERRMRVDTHPEGKLFEDFLAVAYLAHPYRYPTIGWESDLDHLSASDLQHFYERNYTPDQLTIAIVGDVKASAAAALVEKYFGGWRAPSLTRTPPTEEAPQTGVRRLTVTFDAQPRVLMGFHIPGFPHADHATSYALSSLLGSGTTSRLYKALVEKKKVATALETGHDYPGERYAPLLIISAAPRHPRRTEDVLKAIEEELERLKKEPVAEWELEKIRAGVDVGLLNTLQTNAGMAGTLVYNQTVFGDWRYLLRFQKRIHELTSQELQNFARKIFVDDNKTIAVLEPIKKP